MSAELTPAAKVDAVLAVVKDPEVRREIARLRAVEGWALDQQRFAVGGAAVVKRDLRIGPGSGWWPYREVLAPGSTGVLTDIYLSETKGAWYGLFRPDVQWSVGTWPREDTRRVVARPKTFFLPLDALRRRKRKDVLLPLPDGVIL